MEEVIEVVEGDVEGSLGDGHHGYVEGSVRDRLDLERSLFDGDADGTRIGAVGAVEEV